MRLHNIILLLISCQIISACYNHRENTSEVIRKMVGSKVEMPDLVSTYLGRDTSFTRGNESIVKLVVYFDSTACQTCRVNTLYEWKEIINLEKMTSGQFELILIFSPSQSDISNLRRALMRSRFLHPVYFDLEHSMLEKNNFIGRNQIFHTFLLDKNNRIVLVGDPVANYERMNTIFLETVKNIVTHNGIYIR